MKHVVHAVFVEPDHPYTGVDVPWSMDDESTPPLFRRLRGGGMRDLGGGTSADEVRSRRQSRFLAWFAVLCATWALAWIF